LGPHRRLDADEELRARRLRGAIRIRTQLAAGEKVVAVAGDDQRAPMNVANRVFCIRRDAPFIY
jgi:hypothetical protein